MENLKGNYRTTDLGEAAALMTLGFELLQLEPTRKEHQRIFVFADKNQSYKTDIFTVVKQYNQRLLVVDAYSFFLAVKEIKKLINRDVELSLNRR